MRRQEGAKNSNHNRQKSHVQSNNNLNGLGLSVNPDLQTGKSALRRRVSPIWVDKMDKDLYMKRDRFSLVGYKGGPQHQVAADQN